MAIDAGTRSSNEAGTRAGRTPPQHNHPSNVALSTVMAALSDPIRLAIIRELAAVPEWTLTCGSFTVPVGKAARSHHFTVLREAGLIEQRDVGTHRINRLRVTECGQAFPGLLELVLNRPEAAVVGPRPSPGAQPDRR